MRKPSQMEAFDAMYSIAAAKGRGEALFGNSVRLARDAYERTLIGNGYPHAYLEFPLLGEPGFDILSVHAEVEHGATFASGAGFGYQKMFDWFASVCGEGNASCGIELDTSAGESKRVGVYLQFRKRTEMIAPFLESIGESERLGGYMDVLGCMPKDWPPAYVGLFPGRPGSPLRIGGYLNGSVKDSCAADPTFLGEQFRRIGFTAFDGDMLRRCAEFMALAPGIDFQFDIMADGSLGDTFGLSLSFNETKPRQARACMESGYGARICGLMQEWGLADERWRAIAGAAFARHVGFERDDGTEGRFALCVLFNYAKVKFTSCEPKPAKFYLVLNTRELEC